MGMPSFCDLTGPSVCDGAVSASPTLAVPGTGFVPAGTHPWVGASRYTPPPHSARKGVFAGLSRGSFRVLGLVKTTVLLGFTLAVVPAESDVQL